MRRLSWLARNGRNAQGRKAAAAALRQGDRSAAGLRPDQAREKPCARRLETVSGKEDLAKHGALPKGGRILEGGQGAHLRRIGRCGRGRRLAERRSFSQPGAASRGNRDGRVIAPNGGARPRQIGGRCQSHGQATSADGVAQFHQDPAQGAWRDRIRSPNLRREAGLCRDGDRGPNCGLARRENERSRAKTVVRWPFR